MSKRWKVLHRIGDAGESGYRLESGLGRVTTILPNGANAVLRLLTPGDWFGLEVFGSGIYHETVELVQGSALESLERDRLSVEKLLQASSQVQEQLDRELALKLESSQDRSARFRLVRYLNLLAGSVLARPSTDGVAVFVTHEFLSELLWVQKQTVSQQVVNLRNAGLIRTGYSYVELLGGYIELEDDE